MSLPGLAGVLAGVAAAAAVSGPATWAYARVKITNDNNQFSGGNYFTNIRELKFYDGDSKPIATTGGTAIESGHFSSNTAANAFDNNITTLWSGDTNGLHGVGGHPTTVYLGYQFATPQAVAFAQIDGHNVAGPIGFDFEVSNDGSSWTLIAGIASTYTTGAGWPIGATAFGRADDPAFRYLRLRWYRSHTTQLPDAAEVEFRATLGGSNVATGGTAYSTGDLGPTWAKATAFDGNTATFWVSATGISMGDMAIGYDLGSGNSSACNQVRLTIRNDGFGPQEAPKECCVEGSSNGTDWTTLYALTGIAAWSAGEARNLSNPN